MLTVVLVGSSNTRLAQLGEGPRMFTPRGYARRIDGDLRHVGNRHLGEEGGSAPAPAGLPRSISGQKKEGLA